MQVCFVATALDYHFDAYIIGASKHRAVAELIAKEYKIKYPDLYTTYIVETPFIEELFQCADCEERVCLYELICGKCFTERQGD